MQTLAGTAFIGEPTNYSLHTDDCVAIAFVLSFLCIAWVVSHSHQFIVDSIVNIFEDNTRSSRFTKRASCQLQGKPLLIIQAATALGLVATYFIHSSTNAAEMPWHLFPAATLIACIYYLLRVALYAGVNNVFFAPKKVNSWTDFYLLTTLFEGIALFVLSLGIVYLQVSTSVCKILLILLLVGLEIPRIIKIKSIFFSGLIGYIHIFLYFCTLNLAPPFLVWQILLKINTQFT